MIWSREDISMIIRQGLTSKACCVRNNASDNVKVVIVGIGRQEVQRQVRWIEASYSGLR